VRTLSLRHSSRLVVLKTGVRSQGHRRKTTAHSKADKGTASQKVSGYKSCQQQRKKDEKKLILPRFKCKKKATRNESSGLKEPLQPLRSEKIVRRCHDHEGNKKLHAIGAKAVRFI
jgi:hypothetical protein